MEKAVLSDRNACCVVNKVLLNYPENVCIFCIVTIISILFNLFVGFDLTGSQITC